MPFIDANEPFHNKFIREQGNLLPDFFRGFANRSTRIAPSDRSEGEAKGVFHGSGNLVFLQKCRPARMRANATHGKIHANICKLVLLQQKIMGGFPQLLRGKGINRARKWLLCRHLEQPLHRQIPAGIVAAGLLGANILAVIIFLCSARI